MTGTALVDALLLTARIFAVGIAWSWPLRAALRETVPHRARHLAAGAAAVIAGTAVNLLLFLALGEAGLCREPALTISLLAAIVIGGALTLASRPSGSLAEHLAETIPGAATFFLAAAVIFLLPGRGEWIVGGWDPGVYVNEGIALRNEGTFHPADPIFTGRLDDRGRAVFSRSLYGNTERFPGIVSEPERGTMTFEFFRLTPAMIALAHEGSGSRGSLRINTLLAAAAIFLFALFLLQSTGAAHALMASLLLLFQPILLYHTHVPVSEMLQLFLLLAFAVTLAPRRGGNIPAVLFQGILLLLLVLNRFSFLPFAGILIALLSWFDIGRSERRRVLFEHLLLLGAAGAGAAVDALIAPYSLGAWAHLPKLYAVFAAGAAAALLVDALCARESWRGKITAARDSLRMAPALAAVAVLSLIILGSGSVVRQDNADNLLRLVAFVGPAPALLAGAGALLTVFRRRQISDDAKALLLFLAAVTSILVAKKWTVDIYPWATRRHLAYTLPLVAALAAWPPAMLWHSPPFRGARIAALSLLVIALFPILPKSWHAWSRVEYEGSRAMISRVAAELEAGDIIVADTPRWGTPLRFLHGREVLDGKRLWRFGRRGDSRIALKTLRTLGRRDGRIRFLTSTEGGIAIYPHELGRFTLDWESEPFALQEIIHGTKVGDYALRSRDYRLRLYSWERP